MKWFFSMIGLCALYLYTVGGHTGIMPLVFSAGAVTAFYVLYLAFKE